MHMCFTARRFIRLSATLVYFFNDSDAKCPCRQMDTMLQCFSTILFFVYLFYFWGPELKCLRIELVEIRGNLQRLHRFGLVLLECLSVWWGFQLKVLWQLL